MLNYFVVYLLIICLFNFNYSITENNANQSSRARRFLEQFVDSAAHRSAVRIATQAANQTNNNQTSTTNSPAQSTAGGGSSGGTDTAQIPAPTPVTTSIPLPNDVPTQDSSRQARVTSVTQPTTSTQTRSTSRPQILTSTTLPPTSIRNLRPIPTNVLSSFDRFLPCNSHHIRENAQQLNQQTQTRHITPQRHPFARRTVSLDRNSARLIPIGHPRRVNVWPRRNNVAGITNITDNEFNHRFILFGFEFSLMDFDNFTPEFFNQKHMQLAAHFRCMYFNQLEITDGENMDRAMKKMLKQLERYLYRLNRLQHPDYNVRGSIENLILKSIPLFLNIIRGPQNHEFGVQIKRQLIVFFENLYMILVKCVGVAESEKLLNEVANMVINGGNTGECLIN